MRNKGSFTKKVAALLLSGVTLLSGISPAIAEEPAASASPAITATAQPVEMSPTETAVPEPVETAAPTESPEATATAKAEEPAIAPSASPSAKPSASASSEPENAARETAVPTDSAKPTASPSAEEKENIKVDTSKSSVYYAKDIVDYISALSSVRTTADNKLIVHSFDEITDCIQNAKALYFDGTYIVVFNTAEDLNVSKNAITKKLGDVVFEDEAIAVDTGDNNGTEPETSEPQGKIKASSAEAKNAEKAETVVDEASDEKSVKTIALIDSGVNGDYADISVNLTTESGEDLNGHGTSLAGIIKDIAGDKASIISIKAFNSDGTASIATVASAVKYARLLGVDIINISASVLDSENVKPLKDEVQNALDAGITVVASAGNDADDASKYVPANIDGVDTIGAAESLDGWSAFKATASTNIGDCVNYYYIADSTSEAAAMETAVLAAGLENEAYSKSGTWMRFEKVADRDETASDDMTWYSLDELEEKQGFLTHEQQKSRDKVYLNGGHGKNWVVADSTDGGKVTSERYQRADGSWDWHASNFYYYPPGTYKEGADGIQIYCQDPDIKAWFEDGNYTCTSSYAAMKVEGENKPGDDIQHYISFDKASIAAYDPATHTTKGTAYVFTDVNNTLAEGNYQNKTISVGNGDASKVHFSVEGNELRVWFDADWGADMPDDITVTISGGKHLDPGPAIHVQTGSASTSVSCKSPGYFQRLEGGQAGKTDIWKKGTDGYTYNSATVHLNILRGKYTVHKVDANRGDTNAQGDATLAGAVYEAYHSGATKTAAASATTDETGIAVISSLKWGSYFAQEKNPSVGYNLDPKSYSFPITAKGEDPNASGDTLSPEVVIRGGLSLTKNDSDFKENAPQGDSKDLSGAKFDVYNISDRSIFYYDTDKADYVEISNKGNTSATVDGKDVTYGNGNYVLTLTTDADGNASTTANALSYGTYLIVEKKAPTGYLVENDENADVIGTMAIVRVRKEGEIVHADMYDDISRGQLIVGKVDQERMVNYPTGSAGYGASPDSPDHPQGDATLAGAEFTIYLKSDNHVMIKDDSGKHEVKKGEAALTITSAESGIAKTIEDALPYGSYYVVETKAPEGYLLNTEWRLDFRITKDGEVVDFTKADGETSYEERAADQIIRGGVELTKFDTDREITKDADKNVPQGDAVLSGAQFTIYNLSKEDILSLEKKDWINPDLSTRGRVLAQSISEDQAVAVITTDKSGHAATASNALAYGTYLIKETKAPDEGYILNDYWYSIIEVREDGHVYNAVDDNVSKADQVYDGTMVDDVVRGGVKLQKVDAERDTSAAQGDATLKDAEITIYNISPLDVYGAYAQDSKEAPQYDGTVSADGNRNSFHWIASGDKPSSVDADVDVLHKLNGSIGKNPTVIADNAKNGMTDEDGKYSYITNDTFENSTDTAYDDALQVPAIQKSKTETRSFKNAQPVVTIKTDENGIASLGGEALPYGTYVAVETKPSRGYTLNTKWQVVFEIREDGVVVDLTDAEHQLADQVIRGDVRIYKEDLEMSELNGVDRANYGYKADNSTGNSTGTGTDSGYGDKTIKSDTTETSGYKPGSESAHHAGMIDGNSGEMDLDAENNPSQAIGGKNHASTVATLSGIEFTITNSSTLSVLSDAGTLKEYKPGEFVTTITTHYDAEIDTNGDGVADSSGYIAETADKALPYGTYTIQETKSNDAYMLTDGTPRTFEIEYDGEIADTTKQTHHAADAGEELVFRNQIRRGDFDFVKIASHTSDRIQSLWVLENDTSGEKHILVTDKNGEFKSYEYSHSDDTNRNDALLDTIGTDYEKMIDLTGGIADGSIKEYAGVWFGMGEDGSMAKVNDRLGSLPYGQYTLHEVRTNTNDGKELQDVTFYITKNSTFNASGVIEKDSAVHLGTITDEGPSLKTQASADDTKTNIGTAGTTKAILDKISYRELEPGEYTLKTSLVNSATGAVLMDAEGNEFVKEEQISIKKEKGTINVQFDADTSGFGGLDVVVFEELYREENGEMVRVVGHVDRLDSKQTVTFPGIRTTLADTTKKQKDPVNGMYYLTDTVAYNGLEVGKKYTVSGTLHLKNSDGTDAGELIDSDGKAFTSSMEFKAKSSSGKVNVVFEIPRELLSGETVVAFETLSQGEKTIAVHADINDHDQTVTISEAPVLHTTAVNKADGSKYFKAGESFTLTDTVSYENLIPGNTYTLYGEIHQKQYEQDVDLGVLTDENGNNISAVVTFIPDEKNGTQDVEFNIPAEATESSAQNLVVFEKLYEGGTPEGNIVGTHKDIADEGQTVTSGVKPNTNKPNIQTTLTGTDGAKFINPDSLVTLSDKVRYSNVAEGKNYVMKGSLHAVNQDGTDGGVIARAEQEFTPDSSDGDITLTFTFDASSLAGQKVVAFETLYENGEELASHADLTDEGQTVTFNSVIHTTLTGDNGAKVVKTDESVKVSDAVAYAGLKPGTEYTMKGELHKVNPDGSDGGAIVTAEQKFTPDRKDGSITLDFTFNSSEMDGQKVVAFETVYEGEAEIASHKDLADEGQTVTVMKEVPQIHTTLTGVNNSKTVKPDTSVKVTDTVRYSGLKPGTEYTLSGDLHKVNANGSDGGVVAKAEKKFTPERSEGTITLEFTFDASKLGGRKIVAFETVSQNGYEVASHKDLKDECQTVTVENPKPSSTPTPAPKSTPTPTPSQNKVSRRIDTGVLGNNVPLSIAIGAAGVILVVVLVKRRKKK